MSMLQVDQPESDEGSRDLQTLPLIGYGDFDKCDDSAVWQVSLLSRQKVAVDRIFQEKQQTLQVRIPT